MPRSLHLRRAAPLLQGPSTTGGTSSAQRRRGTTRWAWMRIPQGGKRGWDRLPHRIFGGSRSRRDRRQGVEAGARWAPSPGCLAVSSLWHQRVWELQT